MKNGMLGFTRKEILWFATFFVISVSLMVVSTYRLIRKYYNHSVESAENIKTHTRSLWAIQELNSFAINIQRSSLNLIIYKNNPKELDTVKSALFKNKDSLNLKFSKLKTDNLLNEAAADQLVLFGKDYLRSNGEFIKLTEDSVKKQSPEDYNASTMRPILRKFTDLVRQTGKDLTLQIEKATDKGLNLFSQWEFWILCFMLLPYFYFFFRFLYLVLKLIIRDYKN